VPPGTHPLALVPRLPRGRTATRNRRFVTVLTSRVGAADRRRPAC
jgi:hypothetical protein